ncbi:VID27 cytoplasmic protein-domain-containing protein [Sporodiniella umbellata]|nr:VID27 cytoplasmic protein-domain-containing protein [Sporodiniella umbellata]
MFDITDRNAALPSFSNKKKNLITLKYGEFSCYFNEGHRTVRHILYKNAEINLESEEEPFTYNLVVSGVSDPNSLYDCKQRFRMSGLMELRIYRINMNQDICLTWVDKDNNEAYEFICKRAVTEENAQTFMSVAYECIYEEEYKTSRCFIVPEKISALYSPHMESKACSSVLKAKCEVYGKFIPEDLNQEPVTSFISYVPFTGTEAIDGQCLFSFDADLYIYRPDIRDYIFSGDMSAKVIQAEAYTYYLNTQGTNIAPISQRISNDMNLLFVYENMAFCWNYTENKRVYAFKAVLKEKKTFEALRELITISIFETSSNTLFSRHKRSNQDYIVNTFTNINPCFESSDQENDMSHLQKVDSGVCLPNIVEQERFPKPKENMFYKDTEIKNSFLTTCEDIRLSFLIRSNKIGIYSQGSESPLDFVCSIDNLQTVSQPEPFYPTMGMFHNQGQNFLMCDKEKQNNMVYNLDTKLGTIVEEWSVEDEDPLIAICPSSHTFKSDHLQTLVGITPNTLFRIDPRQESTNKIYNAESKRYSSRPEFSTVTSCAKYVAVGSQKGVVRVFDALHTVASITLPPMGEPILSLSITAEGHYVLATCTDFLVLMHTVSIEQAVTLRILPEHVILMNETISFQNAYFDTHNNIICTTGSFIVFWNFRKVCQGQINSYKMERLDTHIVSSVSISSQDVLVAVR